MDTQQKCLILQTSVRQLSTGSVWFRVFEAEGKMLIFMRIKWQCLKTLDIKCNVPILAYLSEIFNYIN